MAQIVNSVSKTTMMEVEGTLGAAHVANIGVGGSSVTTYFLDPKYTAEGGYGAGSNGSGSNSQFITSATGWRAVTLTLQSVDNVASAIVAIGFSGVADKNVDCQTQAGLALTQFGSTTGAAVADAVVLSKTTPSITLYATDTTIKSVFAAHSGAADITSLIVVMSVVNP